ncbi:primase homolog protein-like [Asparagus officinalis]|uniref:primase homolog protein-like n=1 Tax=Asparagus officinalis TaxID=4686 RepID=UPI00098E3011|nr:primase homolog protein-like [Asparagus officinalis]
MISAETLGRNGVVQRRWHNQDTKFQYLWNCKEYLNKASRIILATDADAPGQALAEELARRLGKERCWRVTWPTKTGTGVCKDANEVLSCIYFAYFFRRSKCGRC